MILTMMVSVISAILMTIMTVIMILMIYFHLMKMNGLTLIKMALEIMRTKTMIMIFGVMKLKLYVIQILLIPKTIQVTMTVI